MSRPFRLFLPGFCALLALGFTACVGTIYDRTYSNRVTHYKPPAPKHEVSAAELLKAVEAKPEAPPNGLQPAPDAVPGLQPAIPGDPSAAPAIPGLPAPVPAPPQ